MPTATAVSIQSRQYQQFRAEQKALHQVINAACGICGQRTIRYDGPKNEPDSYELDHKISRKRAIAMHRPELIMDPANCAASHSRCNRAKQAGDASPGLGETSEDW